MGLGVLENDLLYFGSFLKLCDHSVCFITFILNTGGQLDIFWLHARFELR
jgi:hypothetical protein